MFYGVLGALGVLLFLSLRLLTTYRDAGIASYQRDRVAHFRMQLQATLRSCQISAGRNPLLSGEDMKSLAQGLELLFNLKTFGVGLAPESSEGEPEEVLWPEGGPLGGDARFVVPHAFWKEYLGFLQLFPRMILPPNLEGELALRLLRGQDFCLSWKTPRGWFDIMGVTIPQKEGKEREFLLTFERAENFSQSRTLYVLLSLFLVLFTLLLMGVATVVYGVLLKLEHMAVLDKLTGAHTRGAFLEAGEKEKSRALRKEHPLSLVMVDLDNFKRVNDLHGHNTGDFVLRKIAGLVRSRIRKYDIFGRWGGDEFVLLLPETAREEALRVAEKLRECIHQDAALHALQVTASIGVYEVEDLEESLSNIIEKADQRMYAAKEGGRNKVVG
jgi:diguanylate cyclase (GGDEF)-like protein